MPIARLALARVVRTQRTSSENGQLDAAGSALYLAIWANLTSNGVPSSCLLRVSDGYDISSDERQNLVSTRRAVAAATEKTGQAEQVAEVVPSSVVVDLVDIEVAFE